MTRNNQSSPENHRKLSEPIIPKQHIQSMVENKTIDSINPISDLQMQPASLDLRVGKIAYQVKASFLPGKRRVSSCLDHLTMHEINLSQGAVFEAKSVYIVPLQESLALPDDIYAVANAKSSIGRLDVFTRLLTDYTEVFCHVKQGYSGPLYAEISPGTFSIRVHEGQCLNQIRFKKTESQNKDSLHLYNSKPTGEEIDFRVNLRGNSKKTLVGYRAKKNAPLIDLRRVNHYAPHDFWEFLFASDAEDLILEPGAFYILSSLEKISIPENRAAEMEPYMALAGEFRVHYAGFFDPGFGYPDKNASRAVLEVRCHEVPFMLSHGQLMGKLLYENMQEIPEELYGNAHSHYQGQGLRLSKYFTTPDS
jgi:dCTP deaminase